MFRKCTVTGRAATTLESQYAIGNKATAGAAVDFTADCAVEYDRGCVS